MSLAAHSAPAALAQQQQRWRSCRVPGLARDQQPKQQQQQTARRRRGTSALAANATASSSTPYEGGRLRFSKYQGLGNDFILVS
jgi:hypothetical protein